MPTYEYRCKSCGFEFEEFQSITSEILIICPKCAEPSLKRLISSGAGLVFKGSGFYLTDYKKSNSSTTSSNTKTESKPESKTESKSDSKSESPSDSQAKSKPESKAKSQSDSKPANDSSSKTDKK
jgi:putative FmdB family regulatory protein